MSFTLTSTVIDAETLAASLADPRAGALTTFAGWVRNHNDGRQVQALEYEAYETLALAEGNRIIAEAVERFGLQGATCVHRTGVLAIGDMAVWVGATAAHRDEAFRATRFIIDEIKTRLPIWKREIYMDGRIEWVNCQRCAAHEHDRHPVEREAAYYQRQVRLPEMGQAGQTRLKAAKVLVIGAGGLGCPALQALAGAGIGTLGICDFDMVELSNLHRQFLYGVADVGQPKAAIATARLHATNPFITVIPHAEEFTTDNAERLIGGYDLVLSCTDNLAAKFLANDTCRQLGKPLVVASVHRFDGELLTILPEGGDLRALWPETPTAAGLLNCAERGILGAVPALLGTLQALEAIKLLLGQEVPSASALLLIDGLTLQMRAITRPSPAMAAE